FKRELEKLNISPNAISQVFKEMDRENKEGYNEAINIVLKDLYEDSKVMLDRSRYDSFRKLLDEKGVAKVFNSQGEELARYWFSWKIVN
ncbi:hypothetical protein, partial [Helicobacter sp. WB40]